MEKYEKPILVCAEGLAEGIYMASGDGGVSGGDTADGGCQSKYMQGVFHKPKDWYREDSTMLDRGCEGCPAMYSYTDCRAYENNFGDSLMPTWEKNGYLPTQNYKYI